MTAIWGSGPDGRWRELAAAAYQAEAQLHDLVESAPQVLPLAGSPRLTVLGRQVRLGTGSADLLAVESTGRLVIIEVKLAGNAESRRAVGGLVRQHPAIRARSRPSWTRPGTGGSRAGARPRWARNSLPVPRSRWPVLPRRRPSGRLRMAAAVPRVGAEPGVTVPVPGRCGNVVVLAVLR